MKGTNETPKGKPAGEETGLKSPDTSLSMKWLRSASWPAEGGQDAAAGAFEGCLRCRRTPFFAGTGMCLTTR